MADNIGESIATFDQVLARLREEHAKLRDELIPQVAALPNTPLLPPVLIPVVRAAVRRAHETLHEIEDRVGQLLKEVTVFRLYTAAREWAQLSIALSSIGGDLRWENRPVPTRWRGQAAEAYATVVEGQVAAVNQLRSAAQAIAYGLHWLAMSVLVFYVALLAFLMTLGAIIVGAFLTFASGTMVTPAVLAALAVAIPAMATQLGVLLTAAAENYARARTFLQDMRAKALDMSTFPNGNWPNPDPARYNDATVRDGDPSDWTVVG
jgi:hypothetical protein